MENSGNSCRDSHRDHSNSLPVVRHSTNSASLTLQCPLETMPPFFTSRRKHLILQGPLETMPLSYTSQKSYRVCWRSKPCPTVSTGNNATILHKSEVTALALQSQLEKQALPYSVRWKQCHYPTQVRSHNPSSAESVGEASLALQCPLETMPLSYTSQKSQP
jgi:hypothetical protein